MKSLGLVIGALFLLVVPGMMYNNASSSGLVNGANGVGAWSLTCPGFPDVTCQSNVNVGCQASSTYCTLSGQTVSFLTVCSPFTGIVSANFIAFVNSFFSNCGTAATQSGAGQISTFAGGNVTIPGLKATYSYHTLANQRQWSSTLALHPTPTGLTSPYYTTCLSWNGTASNTAGHGQYTTGCEFQDSAATPTDYLMSCYLMKNLNGSDITNAICNNWASQASGGGGVNFGSVLGFGLWLLGAALIIILALGINISIGGSFLASGMSASLGSNRQGSKMAQVFGIGLLIWVPLYSEFSTWFTSGILPNGLDGTTGIVSVAITAMMAIGLWGQTTTD